MEAVTFEVVADDIVDNDQTAWPRHLQRPAEVLGRVDLVGIDERQIERRTTFGGDNREQVEGATWANTARVFGLA